jgi:hypothetical protein
LGTQSFLYLEESFVLESRRLLVDRVASKMARAGGKSPPSELFYSYLKKVYPEEMEKVNVDPSVLPRLQFSREASPPMVTVLVFLPIFRKSALTFWRSSSSKYKALGRTLFISSSKYMLRQQQDPLFGDSLQETGHQ